MDEVTLVDGVAKLVAEDLRQLDAETNWWHKRVRLIEHWLRDETSRVCIPSDGTEEMIRRHIQRGDSYPTVQSRCWKHIVMELRDLPCFAGVVPHGSNSNEAAHRATTSASPSRGKLRPGKELIVPSDSSTENDSNASTHDDEDSNNASSSWSLEPLNPEPAQPATKVRPLSSATYLSRRELTGIDSTSASIGPVGTSFAGLSLLERQMQWLRKKHDKMEAERLRQVEEKERELTFRPKLIRRITYSGDRYFKDQSGSSNSRALSRSESSRRVTDTVGAAILKEKALPKVPRLSHHRRSRKKTPLQSASISQPVGVSCKLLDIMKSELEVSLATTRSNDEKQQQESDFSHCNEESSAPTEHEAAIETPEVPETDQTEAPAEVPPENAPAWSDKPTVGGRKVDVDSSETKMRLILQDASKFELSTMYRKTDRKAGRDGVALHVGRREDTLEEQVIAVLFDKEKVTQDDAERWWDRHRHRFAEYIEEQQQDRH